MKNNTQAADGGLSSIITLAFSKYLGGSVTPSTFMLISTGYLFCIGVLHLVLTFSGKLNPQDPDLRVRMRQVPLAMLKRTDMWSCWTGFNASHSIALMLFWLIYGFLEPPRLSRRPIGLG